MCYHDSRCEVFITRLNLYLRYTVLILISVFLWWMLCSVVYDTVACYVKEDFLYKFIKRGELCSDRYDDYISLNISFALLCILVLACGCIILLTMIFIIFALIFKVLFFLNDIIVNIKHRHRALLEQVI